MSAYDNEIYRGSPETGPTLGREKPSYGAEFYVVKPDQATAQQDEPATEESAAKQSNPVPKKKSRIAKAMKLLASCVTTVAVVTTLAAPAPPVEPEPELPLWPRISPTTYDWISQNSMDCQVANGHDSYCLTAQQEGVYLMWDNGFYTYFEVNMTIPAEDWYVYLYFDTDPAAIENRKTDASIMYSEEDQPAFGTGQIQTTSGETLYVLGMMWGNEMEELPPVQQIVDHLDEYIQISDATPDGWDKLLIGDTMYSEINPRWSGTVGASDSNEYLWYELETVYSLADADCSEDNLICRRRVNGIDWSFYYGDFRLLDGRLLGRVIWAVPGQEDIALGYDSIVGGNPLLYLEGFYADDVTAWVSEFYSDTNQEWAIDYFVNNDGLWEAEQYGCDPSATWPEILEAVVDTTIIKYMVSQIYLVEQMPEFEPVDIPTVTTAETVTEPLSQCEASGHTWVDANHQAPKTCSVCGKTEGAALRADFRIHGLPINITELGTEYDYLTSSANDPELKTWGKLSITDYRVFDGDEKHPALEGYEWHTVSVKIRFDDNVALYKGMSFHDSIENYYDIEGWDATQTYLEEENMIRYGCTVNGTDYTQCLYKRDNTEWSGWIDNPETGISECSVTFDQYIRIPVGYDGVVFGYYDGGVDWGEGQYIYDIADGNTLFFRLDGALAQRMTEPTEVFPRTDVIVLYED